MTDAQFLALLMAIMPVSGGASLQVRAVLAADVFEAAQAHIRDRNKQQFREAIKV